MELKISGTDCFLEHKGLTLSLNQQEVNTISRRFYETVASTPIAISDKVDPVIPINPLLNIVCEQAKENPKIRFFLDKIAEQ